MTDCCIIISVTPAHVGIFCLMCKYNAVVQTPLFGAGRRPREFARRKTMIARPWKTALHSRELFSPPFRVQYRVTHTLWRIKLSTVFSLSARWHRQLKRKLNKFMAIMALQSFAEILGWVGMIIVSRSVLSLTENWRRIWHYIAWKNIKIIQYNFQLWSSVQNVFFVRFNLFRNRNSFRKDYEYNLKLFKKF